MPIESVPGMKVEKVKGKTKMPWEGRL